jgi:hypothetical protein
MRDTISNFINREKHELFSGEKTTYPPSKTPSHPFPIGFFFKRLSAKLLRGWWRGLTSSDQGFGQTGSNAKKKNLEMLQRDTVHTSPPHWFLL